MNRLLHAAAVLCAVGFSASAFSQSPGLTTVTASNLKIGATPVNGTITIAPVDGYGIPESIQGAGSLFAPQAFTSTITNGAIASGFAVPDQCLAKATKPGAVVNYQVTIYDTPSKQSFTVQGITASVCGSTFALDTYAPATSAVVTLTGLVTGTTPLASCKAPSVFYTSSNPTQGYACVGNTYLPLTGSGSGASSTISVQIGTTTTLAPGASATVVNGGTATAPVLNFGIPAGAAGANGATPAITIGSVTSLPPGSTPTVTISGTATAPVFNFGIPQGAAGSGGSGTTGTIPVYTFATLPSPSSAAGFIAYQTDAVAGSVGAVGGGTLTKLVRSLGAGQGYGPADALEKGLPNGTASLDSLTHLPLTQVPVALVSSTSVDLTAAPYYASPNGGTETTSTAAIASGATVIPVSTCSTFSANQYVNITAPGASGTGSIVQIASCSGTTLTVAALPVSYASGARIRHDESVPMQQAITALRRTGGTIYLPDGASGFGQYNLNGPLQDTSASNAMFVMSKDNLFSLASYGITTIQGTMSPLGSAGLQTIIQTDLATGNLFGGKNIASSNPQNYGGLVMAHVRFDKLRFVDTSANPGAVMVNGQYFSNLNIGDVWCISAATGIPTATTGSCVKLGHIGNDVDNYAHMITTVGFYNGVTAGEHTQIDRLYGANTGCLLIPDSIVQENTVYGGALPISTNGAESVGVGNMWGQQITHMVCGGSGPQTFKIARLDAEQSTGTIVEDPNGYLSGMVDYLVAYNDSRSVNTHTVAKCNIGPNLKMTDMSQPFLVNACQSGTSATAGATQIAHFSMQDGSGATTSANTIAPSKPLTNTAITYATTNGVANVAQFVAANGSKAQYADNTYLAFDGTTSFSGCMNTLPTSFAAGDQVAMGNIDLSGTNPNGWSFEHGYDANSATFNLYNGTSNTSLAVRLGFTNNGTSAAYFSSATHRLCFTYDVSKPLASRVTLFVDGVAASTQINNFTSLSGAVTATKPFTVGRGGSNQQPISGGIYNVDLWTGVASAAQMQ